MKQNKWPQNEVSNYLDCGIFILFHLITKGCYFPSSRLENDKFSVLFITISYLKYLMQLSHFTISGQRVSVYFTSYFKGVGGSDFRLCYFILSLTLKSSVRWMGTSLWCHRLVGKYKEWKKKVWIETINSCRRQMVPLGSLNNTHLIRQKKDLSCT